MSYIVQVKKKLLFIFARIIPDRLFLELLFPLRTGYKLDLNNPKTFNEKLQWLKLYNRMPEYTKMVDKAEVKNYVADIIGKEYIIPTLAVYDSVEDIDFDALPDQFVLKCTHDSGGIVICKDKSKINQKATIKKLLKCLNRNYYYLNREWPYKNVSSRIIAEQYMEDDVSTSLGLNDYKIFCFNGKVRFFKIDFGRFIEHHANYYDTNLQLLPFGEASCPPIPNVCFQIPSNIYEMFSLAERLSFGIPFVRVDFYDVNGHIYFGEITFFPASGMGNFIPNEWDRKLGNMILLPNP